MGIYKLKAKTAGRRFGREHGTGETNTPSIQQLATKNINSPRLMAAALWYAEKRGWRVFPCLARGKTPMIMDWPNQATTDLAQIRRWWTQWPNANIGIATGHGLGVLDVDYETGGAQSMRQLREAGDFPTTPTVETGLGCHHYFRGEGLRNRVAILPGLDWRGEGGYVIAPPSIHPSGLVYSWSIKP